MPRDLSLSLWTLKTSASFQVGEFVPCAVDVFFFFSFLDPDKIDTLMKGSESRKREN